MLKEEKRNEIAWYLVGNSAFFLLKRFFMVICFVIKCFPRYMLFLGFFKLTIFVALLNKNFIFFKYTSFTKNVTERK